MSTKTVDIPDIGAVQLYKRRSNRSIRISITAKGDVRVSLPVWAPYKAAITFVKAKQQWIALHRPGPRALLKDGDRVGKAHVLRFMPSPGRLSITTRVQGNEIRIQHPLGHTQAAPQVQTAAQKAAVRALRAQANQLLPPRLAILAKQHGFTYTSVDIKQLTSRWGSCTSKQEIALNLFLMQLPWELIDYVILHELTHTKVLNHGADFWQLFLSCLPNAKELRKAIRTYQPILIAQSI